MKIEKIDITDVKWQQLIEYAEVCSWIAGKSLAVTMRDNGFEDWEGVFVAMSNDNIVGYCTVNKSDYIPNVNYSPYISFVFVDENFRGNRISEKLILYASEYLSQVGFHQVYIVSGEKGLYEKYGFHVIDEQMAVYGKLAQIFMKKI